MSEEHKQQRKRLVMKLTLTKAEVNALLLAISEARGGWEANCDFEQTSEIVNWIARKVRRSKFVIAKSTRRRRQ